MISLNVSGSSDALRMAARLDVVDLPHGVDEVEFLHPEQHRVVDLRLVQRESGIILELDNRVLGVRCIAELLQIQGFPWPGIFSFSFFFFFSHRSKGGFPAPIIGHVHGFCKMSAMHPCQPESADMQACENKIPPRLGEREGFGDKFLEEMIGKIPKRRLMIGISH